jgi:ribosomal protein S18 acetylase RimI-like enzyme
MMETLEIRKAAAEDLLLLQDIGRRTFLHTFSSSNTEESMLKYLAEGFSAKRLHAELSNKNSQFYFAMLGEDVVGYLKLNIGTAQTELKEDAGLEIERIYVLEAYHGLKVGQALYDKAIEIARALHSAYVWLGVWEKNTRAIRFYEKNGFVAFDKHLFRLGDEEQTDIMMKKVL